MFPAQLSKSKVLQFSQQLATLIDAEVISDTEDHSWAFGDTPSLRTLQQRAHRHRPTVPLQDYQDALRSSSSFNAPSALDAMATALGVAGAAEGMAGSMLFDLPSGKQVTELRSSLKDKIDLAWSNEALGRGVAEAKAGRYEDAHRWYSKALELFDRNVDALVARGAAFANEHQFAQAEADLVAALELDPSNANAASYLQTVREYRSKQQEGEQERQQQQQQQQPVQHHAREEPLEQEQQQPADAGRAPSHRGAASASPSSSGTSTRSSSPSTSSGSPSRSPPAKVARPSAADIKEAIRVLAKKKAKKLRKKSKKHKHKKKRYKRRH